MAAGGRTRPAARQATTVFRLGQQTLLFLSPASPVFFVRVRG